MKDFIINLLNKRKYSKTIFPYLGLNSESAKYNLPDRVSPTAYLARIFDPVWRDIVSSSPESYNQAIDFKEFAGSTGVGMYELAEKYVTEKKQNWIKLSHNGIHEVSVCPGTEPTVKLEYSFYNLTFMLWLTKWNMSYRPPDFFECDFKMSAYKYGFSNTGEVNCEERISIENCYISYSGETYFGKKIQSGTYCSEISHDKFQRRRGEILQEWWPFMKKFDETFLIPAKSKLDRNIILLK